MHDSSMKRLLFSCLGLATAASLALAPLPLRAEHRAGLAGEASEHDFLAELPVVLSASRLTQPLADAPGAVTVIDRDMIKASGAREIADLFRLVPGFQVSYANGANPVVAYHGQSGQVNQRMQVLVDGRSAYSPYYLGGVNWNMLSPDLEDIERIEVVRGSNSAAYGANAFLGIANIITRHASETRGAHVSSRLGDAGIRDNVARWGGRAGSVDYRVSTGRREDNGFNGINDSRQVSLLNLRADARLGIRDELQFQLGVNENSTGAGFTTDPLNPIRNQTASSYFAQLQWRRSNGPDEELMVTGYRQRESGSEAWFIPFPALGNFQVDFGRITTRTNLEIQHIFRPRHDMRVVWGGEARHESVTAPQLFNSRNSLSTNLSRLFGNLEWRLGAGLLANFAAMVEKHSLAGTHVAPRLMLNYQPAEGQTLRIGVSKAYRTPSLTEQKCDLRYVSLSGLLYDQTFLCLGGVKPEKIVSREIGYLGEFRQMGLTVDARLFNEHLGDLVTQRTYALPPGWELQPSNQARTFENGEKAEIRGLEYQLKVSPSKDALVALNQAFIHINADDLDRRNSAPNHSTTLFLSRRLADKWQVSLAHHWVGAMTWMSEGDPVSKYRRLDARVARAFAAPGLKGEVALVAQGLTGQYAEFRGTTVGTVPPYYFTRRAFLTLALEF